MRSLLVLSVSLLALAACAPSETPVNQNAAEVKTVEVKSTETQNQAENERIDAWFEERFQAAVAKSPQFMTQLGMKTDYDKWNDPSKTFYLKGLEETREELEFLKANFDIDKLDESHKISYRLFEKNANQELDGAEWWGYGYSFNQMFGRQSGIPSFLINYHRIDSIEDAEAYIARINGVKDYLGQIVGNSKASAARGIQPPAFVYDYVISDSENVLQGAPFTEDGTSTLLADFEKKISDEKLNLSVEDKEGLMKQASDALLTSFKPAYENMVAEMNAQKANSTTDDGAWKLPKGEEYYKRRLNMMTTTDMTATEIHDLGLAEVARIHVEMRAIMKTVGFEGDLQAFFQHLKDDPAQTYEDSDAGRDAYLADATVMIDTMKGRLDEVFLRKPKADLEVKRVEAFREKSAGKAFYNRPAPDGSRPGRYYANLYRIGDMPKYQMEALAYHEGIPGHHMQLAIAQELEGIPKFRKYGGYTAYTEGWGLYSEYMPKEMGFYSDPYSDFGRLAMEIWRAARLVVDTGLHDKKWTREQAIDYLLENTPNPEGDVIKAIERYIVMPGQATAYKIGMLKIQSLREDAKTRLGDKFDIREYHEIVLAEGAVPLDILEERVEAWIQSKA
jgi:uncharacterized protein (DUF885 family)